MRRVSFVHHPRLIFNLTLDLDPDIGVTDGMMSLIVEAVYRGWRDARDFDVLQNFLVKVPVQTDYEGSKGCALTLPSYASGPDVIFFSYSTQLSMKF